MKRASRAPRETIVAIALIALVIAGSYWKLSTMRGVLITDDVFTSDIMNDGFPYRFSMGQALKAGELPLWYPNVYGGFPLLARAESGICYPPNLILFWLFDPYVALNAVVLLTVFTAGLGMYLYAKEIGAGLHGALLAGFAFAYSGFMVSHFKHLSMVNSACWFPLGLLAIERAFRDSSVGGRRGRVRALLLLGVVFALQVLSGHIQIAYYSALAYAAYYAARLSRLWRAGRNERRSVRVLIRDGLPLWFLAAMAGGVLISAVQIVPTYELVQHSQREGCVTFSFASEFPYDTRLVWSFLYPPALGEPGRATYGGNGIFWEDYGYVGFITILLCGIALFRERTSWHVRFFALAGLAAFLLVLGANTPVFAVAFRVVPYMKYFRFPSRMLFIVDAALAVMGGIGLNSILSGVTSGKGGRAVYMLTSAVGWGVLCIAVADLLFFQLRQNAIVSLEKWRSPPRTAVMLRADSASFRVFTLGAEQAHMDAYQRAGGWEGSLTPFIDQREYLQPNLNVLYGYSTPNGYAQLTPAPDVEMWGDQNSPGLFTPLSRPAGGYFHVIPPFKKLLSLHNVKTILSPLPILGEGFSPRGIVGQVRIYDNPDVLPRAFVVGSYRIAGNDAESLSLLAGAGFQPAREAILFEDPGIVPHDSIQGSADITSYRRNEVILRVRASAPALLLLSDTYYPGWEAEVDGAPAPLLRADHTLRAVPVPAGSHAVRFRFRPGSMMIGFLLTLMGLTTMTFMMAHPGKDAR